MNELTKTQAITATQQSLTLPMTVEMKLMAIAPQFYLKDGAGKPIGFIHQKLFKLKEAVQVFSDEKKTQLCYKISADKIIDFNASYHFYSATDEIIGYTQRQAIKSIWRTHFDVYDNEGLRFQIFLKNPAVQVIQGLLEVIPVVGDVLSMVSGYFLNPTYVVTRPTGEVVAEMQKLPALFEGKFAIKPLFTPTQILENNFLSASEQSLIALALLTVIIIQRDSDG